MSRDMSLSVSTSSFFSPSPPRQPFSNAGGAGPSQSPTKPIRPGHGLRVNTDTLVPMTTTSVQSRLRSNSTQTSSNSPLSQQHQPAHHFSRSFSHNNAHPSQSSQSALSPISREGSIIESNMDRNDVALAVSGLRGEAAHHRSTSHGYEPTFQDDSAQNSPDLDEDWVDEDHTLKRVYEALDKSPDDGDTLDLSRRGIESIGPKAVEVFRSKVGREFKGVWRLALSYNMLRDTSIVSTFGALSRLRYLNLKGNNFTEFPSALSNMVALEILDLSKNRISSFPSEPGRLAQLKVLSLTNNRLYALPSYLTKFDHLKVFKVDLNPIEWPPREVLGNLMTHEDAKSSGANGRSKKDEDLRPWIENMKKWMRKRATEGDRLLSRTQQDEDAYLASEEEPNSALSFDGMSGSMLHFGSSSNPSLVSQASQQTIKPLRDESEERAHEARSLRSIPPKSALRTRHVAAAASQDSIDQPMFLNPPPTQNFVKHDRGDSTSSSNVPPLSASSANSSAHSRTPSSNLPSAPLMSPPAAGHSRGASYTATQRLSGTLKAKKSLPDLRQNHAKIIQERRQEMNALETVRPLGMGIDTAKSPLGSPSVWTEKTTSPSMPAVTPRSAFTRNKSADMLTQVNPIDTDSNGQKRDSQETPLADESRNSYFRRLSTLPKSTISKAIPPALLKLVDATRGILYALSQLHSALRQYLIFAVNDRVSGLFKRVMEPAFASMDRLINNLDRFDSTSRRGSPPMEAVKGVFEATKESVTMFAKVVAVLNLQVPLLRGGDARYTRTLLLMIHGSMAEVACSWKVIAPFLGKILPAAVDRQRKTSTESIQMPTLEVPVANPSRTRTPISPIAERAETSSPASISQSFSSTTIAGSPSRQQDSRPDDIRPRPANRRQGGSFSTSDVERGMLIPSPGVLRTERSQEGSSRLRYIRHRPSESASNTLEGHTEESEDGDEEVLLPPSHSRYKSKSSSPHGSLSVPLTPPEKHMDPSVQPRVSRNRGHKQSSSSGSNSAKMASSSSVDIKHSKTGSAMAFDDDLLDVIENATDIAFSVWLKLAEDLNGSSPSIQQGHMKNDSQDSTTSSNQSLNSRQMSEMHQAELLSLLSQAEQVTATLRESLMGVRANPTGRTTLSTDAQTFIKTVVQVSEMVKTISATHTFPTNVRQHFSQLTQSTRECAILLQVSSLRPSTATPAPVPPMSARSVSPMHFTRGSRGEDAEKEELTIPNSATSATGWNGPPSSGLRGLQLPSRQLAMGGMSRSRSATPGSIDNALRAPNLGDGAGPGSGRGEGPMRTFSSGQIA